MKKRTPSKALTRLRVPVDVIERRIYKIRGLRVMIDSDLAELYKVTTGNLNLAVRRNPRRFPKDFMFPLSAEEAEGLVLQNAISKKGRGGRRTPPYAFTEHGVAMLSSVLNSERAVEMNILIIRAFVRMRDLLASHKDLAARVEKLEEGQKTHGSVIDILAEEISDLRYMPVPAKRRIGFQAQAR